MARIGNTVSGNASAASEPTLLDRVLRSPERPFALLHRAGSDRIDVLTGEVSAVDRIADLPLSGWRPDGPRHDVLALLPYRQIAERGFDCRDDGEPILVLQVGEQAEFGVDDVRSALPDEPITVTGTHFDVDDDAYAELTSAVLADEIGQGAGANFVIHRTLLACIEDYSPLSAATIFRRLLAGEQGAYWTFLVHTGARTFVGATPERHVTLSGGMATMNPISGTYRYPPEGPSLEGMLGFLADGKETDELYMVVDEELKMMAPVCEHGGRLVGPYLKEMARLAHTEYLIEGESVLDVRDVLRATMFAPTVTGSPLENACRVIARHEPEGRGYYSGVLALIGQDPAGKQVLDSSILIRCADIDGGGELSVGVGATLVRHSDPYSEVAETRAKAAALLGAIGVHGPGSDRPRAAVRSFGDRPEIRAALRRRNVGVARFWFESAVARRRAVPEFAGRRVLVVDAEDTFTWMLAHELDALGVTVDVRPYQEIAVPSDLSDADAVVMGPGPGQPLDSADPRVAALRSMTGWLLDGATPFVSVCLSHQVLASTLGLPVLRKDRPSQGERREIDLFGDRRAVGFYNTFVVRATADAVESPRLGTTVSVCRDRYTGDVHALRAPGFAAVQFHPESILTEHGPDILSGLLGWAVGTAWDVAQDRAERGPGSRKISR
jgi:phenazine biosynthesis protein phzE